MSKNNNKPMPSSWRNDKISLQFTKLTPDDVVKHEDSYILLLIGDDRTIEQKGKELADAKHIFCKTFE